MVTSNNQNNIFTLGELNDIKRLLGNCLPSPRIVSVTGNNGSKQHAFDISTESRSKWHRNTAKNVNPDAISRAILRNVNTPYKHPGKSMNIWTCMNILTDFSICNEPGWTNYDTSTWKKLFVIDLCCFLFIYTTKETSSNSPSSSAVPPQVQEIEILQMFKSR